MFAKQAHVAVAALAFAVAGSAFAQGAEQRNVFDTETYLPTAVAQSASGLSRAQVRAEFLAARTGGELNPFDTLTVAYVKPAPARAPQAQLAQASK